MTMLSQIHLSCNPITVSIIITGMWFIIEDSISIVLRVLRREHSG